MKICPSIASCDVMNLKEMASKLEKKYQHIHVDIEDGNYIDNITFGMKALKGICNSVKCEVSVHLMVTNPLQYLDDISKIKNISIVFFHPDCTRYPSQIINSYMDKNIKVGLAFNPAFSVSEYEYVLQDKINDILIMTCEPDMRGQMYIKYIEKKIIHCLEYEKNIWIDGAISNEIAKELESIGVDNIVMGRAIYETI